MSDSVINIPEGTSPETRYLIESIRGWLARDTASTGQREAKAVFATIGTSGGSVREENQDRAVAVRFRGVQPREDFLFYAVADGLGGMRGGSDCAESCLAILISELVSSSKVPDLARRLTGSLQVANRLVHDGYKENGGTTLSAIVISRISAVGINVGDSRIYGHLQSGELEQLSVDDTLAGQLAEIRSASTRTNDEPFHDYLAQYVGQKSPLEMEAVKLPLHKKSDKNGGVSLFRGVLLCSDGVHRVGKQMLREVSLGANSSRDLVLRLVRMAEWSGGHDNATALYASSVREFFNGARGNKLRPMIEVWDSFDHLQFGFFQPDRIGSIPDASKQGTTSNKKKRAKRKKTKKKQSKKRPPSKGMDSKSRGDEPAEKQQKLNIEITDSIDDEG